MYVVKAYRYGDHDTSLKPYKVSTSSEAIEIIGDLIAAGLTVHLYKSNSLGKLTGINFSYELSVTVNLHED